MIIFTLNLVSNSIVIMKSRMWVFCIEYIYHSVFLVCFHRSLVCSRTSCPFVELCLYYFHCQSILVVSCHFSQDHHLLTHHRRILVWQMLSLHRVVSRLLWRDIVVSFPSVPHSSSVLSHIVWVQLTEPLVSFLCTVHHIFSVTFAPLTLDFLHVLKIIKVLEKQWGFSPTPG